MSPPSNEPSAQPLLPYISDDHLLFHARLLVDSWTSNANNANLFLTEDSRASVINRKRGRPVVAARGTIVYQYIRTATLDINRRLTCEGRPVLCERDFAAALVALAASPSRPAILHDAKTRYAGLPDGLVDDWHTHLGELRIYLTSGIVPQGADENILNKHLVVAATKAPPPRDEKEGVPPLVLAGTTENSTSTSSSHSTSDTSANLKIAEPETSTKKEDETLQAATHSSDPCLSLIVPSSNQCIDGLRSDGDSAADEVASEDSCSPPAELGDIQPKESSPEAPNNVVVQVRLPESRAPSSLGVSSPPDFLAEVATKKRAIIVSPLSPVISDDALSDPESEHLVDALPTTSPTLVPETSVLRKDTTNIDAGKPLLGKRVRDTAVVEDDGETETFVAGLQEQVGSANKRPHLSDSVDTI